MCGFPRNGMGQKPYLGAVDFLLFCTMGAKLTGAKRREWMGCWGLLGLLFRVIVDHSLIPYV